MLDHVRMHGESSRARLVEATGLGRSVVTQRVDSLLDYGLLAEDGLGPSTGGRAPRLLRFRADAGYLLVADLGATSMDVALADLSGEILAHRDEPADIAAGPDAVLARVEELFDECEAEAGAPGSLWGIGIGVPGPVEFESGRPISPPIMPGWDGYGVRQRFAERGVPVWVDNDVNVMALGELMAGSGRGIAELRLRQDRHRDRRRHRRQRPDPSRRARAPRATSATSTSRRRARDDLPLRHEPGVSRPTPAAPRSRATAKRRRATGRSATLRTILDEKGFIEAADVALASKHGDPVSVELITEAGRLVGQVLTGVVNFFNPSLLVIGGGVAGSGDLLLATIRQSIYRRSLPLATRDLIVRRSELDGRAGVIGAATMVANELFARDYLPRWLEARTPPARR